MNNLTLLIHYYRDSPERERNLILVRNWAERLGIKWCVFWDKKQDLLDGMIYRTRALNIMAQRCTTAYVGIWDTDVIIPESQIDNAYQLLCSDESDCVYPYDGEFRNYKESATQEFAATMNYDKLQASPDYRVRKNRSMVGGALLIRRDKYLEIGGENERFISYGPEDKERFHRIKSLLTYARVPGPLLHLHHPRLENTSTTHKYFERNVAECEKVCAMGPDELRAYIKTWEWVK